MAGLGGSPPTPVSIEGIKKVKGRMQRLAKFMKRGRIMVRPEGVERAPRAVLPHKDACAKKGKRAKW